MANVRPGTKSAFAIAVMEKLSDKPMDKVIPKIAEAAGLTAEKARHYYVLFVRKGLAPGVVPPRATALARVDKKASKNVKAVNVEKLKAAISKKKASKARAAKKAEPKAEDSTTAAN
jgi:hypothetical protein